MQAQKTCMPLSFSLPLPAKTIDNRMTTNTNDIENIYRTYSEDVLTYFMSYTHDRMTAEDMLHDLFLKLMKLDVITLATAKSLLFVMASRMITDHARHRAYVREYQKCARVENSYIETSNIESHIDGRRLRQLESECLAGMKESCAAVYRMKFHEDRSAKEIALLLDMNQRTVEGHIYQLRKLMRQRLAAAL